MVSGGAFAAVQARFTMQLAVLLLGLELDDALAAAFILLFSLAKLVVTPRAVLTHGNPPVWTGRTTSTLLHLSAPIWHGSGERGGVALHDHARIGTVMSQPKPLYPGEMR